MKRNRQETMRLIEQLPDDAFEYIRSAAFHITAWAYDEDAKEGKERIMCFLCEWLRQVCEERGWRKKVLK